MDNNVTVTLPRPDATLPRALKLAVVSGPNVGVAMVASPCAVVGRAKQADLCLTDAAVSSFHVELRVTTLGIEVRDLGSRNGTFFEGARVICAMIPPGRSIVIGSSTISVDQAASDDDVPEPLASFGALRTASHEMQAICTQLARLAPTDLSVLVEGRAGSGKDVVARAIHEASKRAHLELRIIDCAALPADVAEHLFEAEVAEGGTLQLDAVDELAPSVQAILVKTLDRAPARVISTTRRELRALVNTNRFREDLYVRLAQARIVIPPLAARTEDIATLAVQFLQNLPDTVHAARSLSREAMEDITRREYSGEVRELRAVIERAAMVAKGAVIEPADLAFARILGAGADHEVAPFKDAKRTVIDTFERDYLEVLVSRSGENLSRASILSGLDRHHLRELLRKHGLRKT